MVSRQDSWLAYAQLSLNLTQQYPALLFKNDQLQIALGDHANIAQLFLQCKTISESDGIMDPTDGNYDLMKSICKQF